MIDSRSLFVESLAAQAGALPRARHSSCSWPVWKKRQAFVRCEWHTRHRAYHRAASTKTFHRLADHLPCLLSRTTVAVPLRSRSIPRIAAIKPFLNTRECTADDRRSRLLSATSVERNAARPAAALSAGRERKRRYARAACHSPLVFKSLRRVSIRARIVRSSRYVSRTWLPVSDRGRGPLWKHRAGNTSET